MTPDGLQNPTLHVNPGDHLIITVTNNTPAGTGRTTVNPPNCGATTMNSSSVNIHYHGTNTSPKCPQDEVIRTSIPAKPSNTTWAFLRTSHPDFIGTKHVWSIRTKLQGGGTRDLAMFSP
jgi:FtsP/CotA-like multicopper oxidase with cupredoxin domain